MRKLFVALSVALFLLPNVQCMDQDGAKNAHLKAIIEELDKPQRTLMNTDLTQSYQDLTALTYVVQNREVPVRQAHFESLDPETKLPENEICTNSARPMQRTPATNTQKKYNFGPLSRHEIVEK